MISHFPLIKSFASYHVTISPHKIINILVDFVSNHLTLNSTVSKTHRDGEVANMLFESVESILNSVSYSFENDFTFSNDIFVTSPPLCVLETVEFSVR